MHTITKQHVILFLLTAFLVGCATTEHPKELEYQLVSDLQKSSYAQGVEHVKNLQKSQIPLDRSAFLAGIDDMLNHKVLRLNPKELQKGLDWVFVQHVLYNQKLADENQAKGKAFLNANKQKPGIVTLPSGLQYNILASGSGTKKPMLNDKAIVRYRICRLNGEQLTVSGKDVTSPSEIAVKDLTKGWKEAMLLMTEGDKWQLFVPAELAYGEAGASGGGVQPNESLVYEVELVSIIESKRESLNSNRDKDFAPSMIKKSSSW
jgi:FKBP-type peptidyl-prolyl cis-trans isomerase FklB